MAVGDDEQCRRVSRFLSFLSPQVAGHNFPVWDVAFSPIGFYFVTGGSNLSSSRANLKARTTALLASGRQTAFPLFAFLLAT
jgi:WD40 repeat protein